MQSILAMDLHIHIYAVYMNLYMCIHANKLEDAVNYIARNYLNPATYVEAFSLQQ